MSLSQQLCANNFIRLPQSYNRGFELPSELDNSFLLEKLWEVYKTTDDRRRKAFHYLYLAVILFILLPITERDTLILPFLPGTQLEAFIALSLVPVFMCFLLGRYIYLCGHSLRSQVVYLQHFQRCYAEQLSQLHYSLNWLQANLKLRDSTENLNCFHFPVKRPQDWERYGGLGRALILLLNIAIAMSVIIPFIYYLAMVVWFGQHSTEHFTSQSRIGILVAYCLLGALLLFYSILMYFRVKEDREFFRQRFWKKQNEVVGA